MGLQFCADILNPTLTLSLRERGFEEFMRRRLIMIRKD